MVSPNTLVSCWTLLYKRFTRALRSVEALEHDKLKDRRDNCGSCVQKTDALPGGAEVTGKAGHLSKVPTGSVLPHLPSPQGHTRISAAFMRLTEGHSSGSTTGAGQYRKRFTPQLLNAALCRAVRQWSGAALLSEGYNFIMNEELP
ncbi:hypothetical protein J6590_048941 [Homalodisca vitripennis]|nr:hypothetical protein J6590_048941 [Homalodisca vitripennis]